MVWKGDASGRRLAKSLITLIGQVDAKWPNRDKSSDGSIGDAAHAARASDHNPNAAGVVTALDLDRDIAAGFNARALAEALVASRDPRIKYIISNAQIVSSKVSPWQWRPYSGANAHREHIHVSVDADPALYDDARPWAIPGVAQPTGQRMRFTGITATVFGGPSDSMSGAQTAYGSPSGWWDRPGVALPARFEGVRPRVLVSYQGRTVDCEIVDVGPWNDRPGDPYWLTGTRPKAEQGLVDDHGRIPTNKAGIDLTPAAARAIGLNGKGLVDWDFVGALTQLPPPTSGQTMSSDTTATPYNANIEDCLIELAKAQRPILERYLKAPSALSDEEKRRLVIMALGGTPPPSAPVLIAGPSASVAGATTTGSSTPEPETKPTTSPTAVNISAALAGVAASLGLSATGVIGAPVGPDATTVGMLLPLISIGASALGIPAPIVSIVSTLLGRMFPSKPTA